MSSSRLARAGAYVDDAVRGVIDDDFKRPRLQQLYHNLAWVRRFTLFVYQLLSFFEQPQWCYETSCHSDRQFLSSGFARLPIGASNGIEFVCLLLMWHFSFVKLLAYGWRRMSRAPWFFARILLLLVATVDVIITFSDPNHFRLAPLVRPAVFVAANMQIRAHVNKLMAATGEFSIVILMLLILLAFSSCLGVMLFDHDRVLQGGVFEGQGSFPDIGEGIMNLLILLTTANFPDIMLPYYAKSRWFATFFVVFLVVGLFGLMSLALAVVYDSYKGSLKLEAEIFYRNREKALRLAFEELAKEAHGTTTATTTNNDDAVSAASRSPHLRGGDAGSLLELQEEQEQREELDTGNKALTWSQAQRRRCCPSPAERKKLRRCIESPRFEYGIALALICNAVVVFCEIGTDLRGDFVVEAAAWEIVEAVFTTLFILEMVLKLLAFGCAGYWGNVLNAYDGIITLVSGAAELYVFIPNNYNNPSLVRYVLLARLLRLARLLSAFTCFQVVFGTLRRIVPMMATFIGMLWCIVSSFAAAGVALFGGLVYVNNTKLVEAELPDTYYYM
eukprot:g5435.t1